MRKRSPGRWKGLTAAFCAALMVGSAPTQAEEPAVPLFWQPADASAKLDAPLPRLRFLTADGFPPFNSLDAEGRPFGFNVDLARALCAELSLAAACTIEVRPFDALETALRQGQGDAIIAGLAIDAGSRMRLAFSRPYISFPARFVMQKSEAAAEPLWRALAGRPVGVVTGTAHERFLRAYFPQAGITTFPQAAAMLDAVAAGRVRAAFGDGMRLSFWLAEGRGAECCLFAGGPYLAPGYFGQGMAIAMRTEDRALLKALDGALAGLAAQRKTAELYFRWFPVGYF